MSTLPVFDKSGAEAGAFEVADGLLVRDKGEQAVHDAVVAYLAGLRAGSASTLAKGEVAGSNRKPWRQKGTGRARAGYRQSPVWRGGGVAHGPHPRSYAQHLNRKVAKLAFRRAFSDKLLAGALKVVDELSVAEPKTRHVAALLRALGVRGPALLVVAGHQRALTLAARNLPLTELVRAADVSVYQLVRYPQIVVTRPALELMVGRLQGEAGGAR